MNRRTSLSPPRRKYPGIQVDSTYLLVNPTRQRFTLLLFVLSPPSGECRSWSHVNSWSSKVLRQVFLGPRKTARRDYRNRHKSKSSNKRRSGILLRVFSSPDVRRNEWKDPVPFPSGRDVSTLFLRSKSQTNPVKLVLCLFLTSCMLRNTVLGTRRRKDSSSLHILYDIPHGHTERDVGGSTRSILHLFSLWRRSSFARRSGKVSVNFEDYSVFLNSFKLPKEHSPLPSVTFPTLYDQITIPPVNDSNYGQVEFWSRRRVGVMTRWVPAKR